MHVSSRCFALAVALLAVSVPAISQNAPAYPSETPAHFQPTNYGFDYERRDVMIPMRDGVRLHTVILLPKGAKNAPILFTRTPYSATALTSHAQSAHLGPILQGYDNATDVIVNGGYIRVVQDIRGKYGSEGDYIMNRPIHGPQNPTPIDESTDTYDTIDWLVKNVPESNGKVGILGISYDGFLPLMALIHPHPALKVDVPMNPMVDGWMGDDWFHNGAFRQQNLAYIYEQSATRANTGLWWTSTYDDYDMFMRTGSAGNLAKERGMEQLGFWKKVAAHPAYDAFWSDQALDKILAKEPMIVPTLLVHSLWDQEDIYGAIAVWKALKPRDTANDKLFLAMGPWHHGQEIEDASTLGELHFGQDTGLYFRQHVLAPFLAHYLKDDPKQISMVNAFETGDNKWEELPSWPDGCAKGCTIQPTPLYLEPGLGLDFDKPKAGDAYTGYISDPAKPVPFRKRPIQPVGYTGELTWSFWLVDDQREPSGRPDVLSFETAPLTEPVKVSGQPVAHLIASTSGTDSDWVVKLIDVYPDEVAEYPHLGGYELMVSADILRGRYREGFTVAKPIQTNTPLPYTFELPTANHVFLPRHRIMVQVQSAWFPLYDRNPQKFVPNIMFAEPGDYQKAEQRIYHAPDNASYVELPLVKEK
ncbi:MAG TPA: CocE/NonD family hydrolase [Acidobacteriaceae bacterium]